METMLNEITQNHCLFLFKNLQYISITGLMLETFKQTCIVRIHLEIFKQNVYGLIDFCIVLLKLMSNF